MSDYTTVFEISRSSNGIVADTLFRVLIGLFAVLVGLIRILRRAKASNRSIKEFIAPVFISIWGLLWLCMHYPLIVLSTSKLSSLLEIERNGTADVIEGEVRVEREQLRSGHSSGDLITIGGKKFEINYFLVTPGYNKTIAHGGVLREGVYARVHYHDGIILKLEIKK